MLTKTTKTSAYPKIVEVVGVILQLVKCTAFLRIQPLGKINILRLVLIPKRQPDYTWAFNWKIARLIYYRLHAPKTDVLDERELVIDLTRDLTPDWDLLCRQASSRSRGGLCSNLQATPRLDSITSRCFGKWARVSRGTRTRHSGGNWVPRCNERVPNPLRLHTKILR